MTNLDKIDKLFQEHTSRCERCAGDGPKLCVVGLQIMREYQRALAEVMATNQEAA